MKIFFVLLAFVLYPVAVFASDEPLGEAELRRSAKERSVFQLLESSSQHKLFVSALKMTGLDKELEKNESWTVMAPTDRAFAKIPRETVHSLFAPENIDKLRYLMSFHIQKKGLLVAKGLPIGASRYTVFNDREIVITKDVRGITLNGAYMVAADIQARNGIVHFVDSLITP